MNLQIMNGENEEQYIWRIGMAKDAGSIEESWPELADIMNAELGYLDDPMSPVVYRKAYRQAKKFYDAGVFEQGKSNEEIHDTAKERYGVKTSINKDGTYSSDRLVEMSEEQSKNPAYVLEAHGFDCKLWDIVSAKNSMWNQGSKDGVKQLYSSSITVKPKDEGELSLDMIAEFFDKLDRSYSVPSAIIDMSCVYGNKMLLIDIADLHMNLQASIATTGNEYDCDIAEERFFGVINDVLSRTEHQDFDEVLFCIGGDMLNGDNLAGTTTKGTAQDNDIHYYDAYERLCNMTVKAIDIIKSYCCCKVDVVYVPGNHDEVTGFKLAKYVEAWFRNDELVEVDSKPFPRKYKLYGKTLMCFAHDGKVAKLPAVISNEARDMWAKADTVEVFLQHMHTEQVLVEENNIRIQRLPTVSGRSKWSADCGYWSKCQCKSFVFDKEHGLTDILYTNIK